jgi:hypothetical protein
MKIEPAVALFKMLRGATMAGVAWDRLAAIREIFEGFLRPALSVGSTTARLKRS